MLPAHLRDRPIDTQACKHDLELLPNGPFAVLLCLAQRDSPSVERPILEGAPDTISASALRAFGSDRVREPLTSELSTTYRGADHCETLSAPHQSIFIHAE